MHIRRSFTEGERRTSFEMVSDTSPTDQEVIATQVRWGYDPRWWGAPQGVTRRRCEGKIVTHWWCAGSPAGHQAEAAVRSILRRYRSNRDA